MILDAGCGTGASLALMRQRGFAHAFGVDLDPELLLEAHGQKLLVSRADLALLPVNNSSLDLVLAECVWNLTDRRKVLAEFHRILRPEGHLAVTDIFSRAPIDKDRPQWPVRCCFSQAVDLATVAEMVTVAGFEVLVLEDHTRLLKQTAAEFVFAHGSLLAFWEAVTGDKNLATAACTASAAVRPGLFLLIAKRKTQ
jgi:SAM-dependent methyltransferase